MTSRRGDGLSGLLTGKPSSEKTEAAGREPETRVARPKFDFYTILPETETVLPEREAAAARKTARPEEGVSYVLQAASYASFKDADELKARLALMGLEAHIQKVTIEGRGEFYRVRLGPYVRLEQSDAAGAKLQELGIKPLRLKVKKRAEY
jgi:cell division protein FtsN